VQLSRHISCGEERLDEVLRAVSGTGIADYPAVNVIGNAAETAPQIRHLVFDDHVEADRLAGAGRRFSWLGWISHRDLSAAQRRFLFMEAQRSVNANTLPSP